MSHRVVITGIGPVTSAGIGREPFFNGIWNHPPSPQAIPARFAAKYAFRSKWYLPVPEVCLADYQISVPHESLMQPIDRMAVLGARLALEDAGYLVKVGEDSRMTVEGLDRGAGMLLGSGLSGLETAFDSYLSHCVPRELLESITPERKGFARMVIPKTMPNSTAAWTSIAFGLGGPCNTLNASCASGTYAIGEAFRRVKDGYASVMLTGGIESLHDREGGIMRGFDVLGVLTQSPTGRPEPFSPGRSGFLFAEGGACVLILERLENAVKRGARIYAEIVDFRSNSDAYSIVQIDPEGKQILRLLGELSAGCRIDYLNAHGTATLPNDEVEARAIRCVFGDQRAQPLINSTKGVLGHTLGASGAIEAAVTALSISRGAVHGNLTREPMDNLNLPLEFVNARIDHALTVSYGFGGHNAGLLLRRYEP